MSIPPLVCSTPPPPDQCEDDREPEDFGFQYNLSQEEDDDYDFGNFSTYNQYQAAKPENEQSNKPINTSPAKDITIEDKEITSNLPSYEFETLQTNEINLNLENEIIEDLNLEIGKEIENTKAIEPKIVKNDGVKIFTVIPSKEGPKETPIVETKELSTPEEDYIVQSTILNNNNEPKLLDTKIETDDLKIGNDANAIEVAESKIIDTEANVSEVDLKQTNQVEDISLEVKFYSKDVQDNDQESNDNEYVPTIVSTTEIVETVKTVDDDDFGDFEDFQVSSGVSNIATVIDSCENPWESNDVVDDDFGDFKANFNEENDLFKPEAKEQTLHSKEDCNIQSEVVNDDDDDFGDFDDFQSSSAAVSVIPEEPQSQMPVLNLQSSESESQIIETIDKVLSSIFEFEVEEPAEELNMKLESVLGVTWGHLLETDERQPYILQWNNSTAQKLLLKALCIDSRNILFGPKWSYNMPKYAVNLTAAPLQPQKQTTSSSATISETLKDKSSSKSGTWSDPFTSDTQESTIPEPRNEAAAIPIGPTDLDVFEASTSSKPDKIYSNTLNIQPLRQISLPDTHIFTPTDSETPRSKTIHYDDNPPLHLPQTSMTSIKNVADSLPAQTVASNNENDDDYWEFQDFKGAPSKTSEPVPSTSKQTIEKTEESPANPITYATQVLQPIKVEPMMPTLNWPAPGQVKETFEDFSSFVSSSSWSQDKQGTANVLNPIQIDKPVPSKASESAVSKNDVTASDDEFDTFQSALPSNSEPKLDTFNTIKPLATLPISSPSQPPTNFIPQNFGAFENTLPKIDRILPNSTTSLPSKVSDNIAPLSTNFAPTVKENISKKKELTNSVLPTLTPISNSLGLTMLQPVQASSSNRNNQSKTTQILQPLSLESYSQINWPNPGIDLQDLSRFNPVNTLQNLKCDLSTHGTGSPVHGQKGAVINQSSDDDWGEFVSSIPKPQQPPPKKPPVILDDDEWTDFISSPNIKPQNGLNTISLNVHTNLTSQKTNPKKVAAKTQVPLEIPALNYVTPKSNSQKAYSDRHFQNL